MWYSLKQFIPFGRFNANFLVAYNMEALSRRGSLVGAVSNGLVDREVNWPKGGIAEAKQSCSPYF